MSACSPEIMLQLHREQNPDGPYAASYCRSPDETGVGRWDCPPNRVEALRREAAAMRERIRMARIAAYVRAVQQAHADLVWRWSGVAECESGGDWHINTGNGYYGGVQFLLSTWRSVGGSGYPHENSPGEQAYRAEILKNRSGLGQWPVCGRYYR